MEDIGKMIYEQRNRLGLTLEEVGKAVGVGKSTVRKWENGMIKNMGRDKIALLANVLQLPPVAFVPGGLSHEYSYDEQRLINIYRKLSDHGKELLHERAQELCILYNEGEKSNDTSNSSVG